MVRYSDKQLLLFDISNVLDIALADEARQAANSAASDQRRLEAQDDDQLELCSSDDDSDDEELSASSALMKLYVDISKQRYAMNRNRQYRRNDKMNGLLQHYEATTNMRMYRGLVRMTPQAFKDLTVRLQQTESFGSGSLDIDKVREMAAVAFYRLGRSGNSAGERDASLQCGCSVGSLIGWTERTVAGLMELNKEVMEFASETERQASAAWVRQRTGVAEWGKGWLVVDGTHIKLETKPAIVGDDHRNYKGTFSINIALVILPHSLRIVESVVGQPGCVQDSKVWVSASNILKKPRLYLDEGEFIWVDGGYGHSMFTVEPFSHLCADRSRDMRHFNYNLSGVRVRVEHAIAYLKNRFMCLKAYRGNIYRVKDRDTAAHTIQACIIAHTFASRYDGDDELRELLEPSFSEEEVHDILDTLQQARPSRQELRRTRQAAQRQHEEDIAQATAGMSQHAISRMRSSQAHDLREDMFQALFRSTGREEEDTTAQSRRHEKTADEYASMMRVAAERRSQTSSAARRPRRPRTSTQASTQTSASGLA